MKNFKNIIEQKYPPENPNDLWMKDDVLYKSTHKGWTPLTAGGGSSTNGVISTTWLELKDKRDAGKLISGSLYRITDYQCTTSQENTRSAGHQFDIVLLALSENKLAEEGWAMMHDNIYDVTFEGDGVTKKCYIYPISDENANLVDCDTLLGYSNVDIVGDLIINEENKTAFFNGENSTSLDEANLTYNYFQNSNLSAWKVWYCLDNDTSRFAWADDSVDEDSPASINIFGIPRALIDLVEAGTYIRNANEDIAADNLFAWKKEEINKIIYTTSEIPTDNTIYADSRGTMVSGNVGRLDYTSGHEGTGLPNGRGVIYRLIDEFNNDCPYDFKNIMHTNGSSYSYTFNIVNTDDSTTDASLSYTTSNNKITNFVDFLTGLSNTIPSIMFAVTSSHYICGNVVDMGTRFLILVMAGNILRNTFRICIDVQAALASEAHLTDTTFWNCESFSFFQQLTSPFYINGEPVNINS